MTTSDSSASESFPAPFAVGFIGRSGVGKTTLLEKVAAILTKAGWRVGVLKDAHHGFDMDKPGKDSWRYREAGAKTVIVRSDVRWVKISETAERAPIETLLTEFRSVDIVLVEGFKHEGNFPKIEVRRTDAGSEPPLAADVEGIIAVAADAREPGVPESLPFLPLNCPQSVAEYILALRPENTK